VTPCEDCTESALRMSHGFQDGCIGCSARAAARSPQFHRARSAGVMDRQYHLLLQSFGLTHDQVKAASSVDWMTKRKRARGVTAAAR